MMRKIREVLRLMLSVQMSSRAASQLAGVSANTASRYRRLIDEQNLSWNEISNLSDDQLNIILFPNKKQQLNPEIEPNWSYIHQEMRRKGLTLQLLWHEYKMTTPDGLAYTTFTRHYRAYRNLQDLVMRQHHKPGEKVYVDYSGQRVPIINMMTGTAYLAEIFVGVLGASNYSYAEATFSQSLPDWISSHVRMFEFFGALPQIVVPDNLRSAVTKACAFEPILNPTYQEFAKHYNIAIVPARKYRPKDKALVEKSVQLVQRWILAQLRNHVFHSLDELNAAIRPLLEHLNQKKFKKVDSSRRLEFENVDYPAMHPLPAYPFETAEWIVGLRVGLDYHVIIEQHAYSVPYRLVKDKVDARITQNQIEFFHQNKRVATHARCHQAQFTGSSKIPRHTTQHSHMPKAHQRYADQSPDLLLDWAIRVGESTLVVFQYQLENKAPEAGYRSCLGLQKLAKAYGEGRLEDACQRSISIKSPSYTSIKSILKNGLDQRPITTPEQKYVTPTEHENVRGETYYSGEVQ